MFFNVQKTDWKNPTAAGLNIPNKMLTLQIAIRLFSTTTLNYNTNVFVLFRLESIIFPLNVREADKI